MVKTLLALNTNQTRHEINLFDIKKCILKQAFSLTVGIQVASITIYLAVETGWNPFEYPKILNFVNFKTIPWVKLEKAKTIS